jgi:hypothetical protein
MPREQNGEENDLMQNAPGYQLGDMDTIIEIADIKAENKRKDILEYLQDPS